MFDLFRSRDKAVRYLLGALLGLVALSMVITLIPGYGAVSAPREQLVAEIGGEPLTVREVQQTIQAVTRNRQVPDEMLQFYLPQIIDQMITERAVAYQAKRMGFRITDEEVANAIRSMLTQYFPDGNIPDEAYRQFLQQQGQDVTQFERNIRQNLLQLRLQNIALEGAIVTPDEVEREFHRKNDKVKVQFVKFSPPAEPSLAGDGHARRDPSHYNAAKAQYQTPEKRSLGIVIADEAKIGAAFQVPEAQLRAAYSQQVDRFRTPERVKVRHILIKTAESPKDQIPKLEAKANDILKQLKGGADFAKLAKENSEDPGSAVKGGDLDWIVRGQTVPAFEQAAFSLKPNELSNIVKTEYGFHILQVQEKEAGAHEAFRGSEGSARGRCSPRSGEQPHAAVDGSGASRDRQGSAECGPDCDPSRPDLCQSGQGRTRRIGSRTRHHPRTRDRHYRPPAEPGLAAIPGRSEQASVRRSEPDFPAASG